MSETEPIFKSTKRAPVRKAEWSDVSWVMASDVVGVGVLTLAKATSTLGWLGAIYVMVIGLLACIFSSQLMVHVVVLFPESSSMAEACYWTIGGLCTSEKTRNNIRRMVTATCYGFAFCAQGGYILVLAKSLGGAFYEAQLCLPVCATVSMFLLLPSIQTKSLADITNVCIANLVIILAVIMICSFSLMNAGPLPGAERVALNTQSSFVDIVGDCGMVVYAYAANWMYFELMSEMKKPEEFQKAWMFNAPLQLTYYLLAGLVGYYYRGALAPAYLLDALPFDNTFRIASVLLFAHVVVSFTIKSTILARYVKGVVQESISNPPEWLDGWVGWNVIAVTLMCMAWVLALSVPFFGQFVGLMGSLVLAPISFLMPIAMFLAAKMVVGDKLQIPLWYWPCIGAIVLIACTTATVGTYSNVLEIYKAWGTFGAAFACHCEDMWATCACSPNRLGPEMCPAPPKFAY